MTDAYPDPGDCGFSAAFAEWQAANPDQRWTPVHDDPKEPTMTATRIITPDDHPGAAPDALIIERAEHGAGPAQALDYLAQAARPSDPRTVVIVAPDDDTADQLVDLVRHRARRFEALVNLDSLAGVLERHADIHDSEHDSTDAPLDAAVSVLRAALVAFGIEPTRGKRDVPDGVLGDLRLDITADRLQALFVHLDNADIEPDTRQPDRFEAVEQWVDENVSETDALRIATHEAGAAAYVLQCARENGHGCFFGDDEEDDGVEQRPGLVALYAVAHWFDDVFGGDPEDLAGTALDEVATRRPGADR